MMNTKTHLTLLFLFSALITFGQSTEQDDQFNRIKSYKVAFFTKELSLSTEDAANFWPIYNKFEAAQIEMWTKRRNRSKDVDDLENLEQKQALSMLEEYIDDKTAEHKRTMKLYKDLLDVLPANKVLMLPRAEDRFRRKLMRMHRNRDRKTDDTDQKEDQLPLLP